MTYSCAIFDQKDDNPAKDDIQDPLEAAQLRKMNRILDNSQVEPGFRILEIGSGWGGLAIEAAKRGCTVDTITLSVEQQELARQRIEHACVSVPACPFSCACRRADPIRTEDTRAKLLFI